jgi:hypothetical protein
MTELAVLLEQLDELLASGVDDEDDALEIAIVAGLAARLGAETAALKEAVAWRDAGGHDLLEQAFDELDLDEIIEGIDGVLAADADEEEVEEALYELDDVVAAAVWCGRSKRVLEAARQVAATIRQVPEPFAPLADYAVHVARSPAVAADLDVYDYWLAVADAGKWKSEEP